MNTPFIHFDTDNWVDKITAPLDYYNIELGRTLSVDDIADMDLEKMPGFILKWTYGPEIDSGNIDHEVTSNYGFTWKYNSNMKSWKMIRDYDIKNEEFIRLVSIYCQFALFEMKKK